MGLGPFNHLLELFPVVHCFKRQMLYRCTSDNQAIKIAIFNLIKSLIKSLHMLCTCRFRLMRAHVEEVNSQLQRSISQVAQYLSFRHHFLGHEIEYQNIQRADILMVRPIVIHDKDILRT